MVFIRPTNCLRIAPWVCAVLMVSAAQAADTPNEACGSLASHYGPFDYRKDRDKLPIVENYHFTKKVEGLVGGMSSRTPGGDLEYVLKTFPNHHRALVAVVRWSKLQGTQHPKDLKYSVDCHFERALRFKADDAVVRMLYANWLGDTDRRDEALRQLDQVEPGDSPLTVYNLGLVYAQLGGHEKALAWAHKAEAMGYMRPALRELLQKSGHWRDANPSSPDAGASAASSVPAASSN